MDTIVTLYVFISRVFDIAIVLIKPAEPVLCFATKNNIFIRIVLQRLPCRMLRSIHSWPRMRFRLMRLPVTGTSNVTGGNLFR